MRVLSISTFSNAVQYYRHLVPNEALRAKGVEVDHYFLEELADSGRGNDGFPTWLYENVKKYDLMHTGYMTTEAAVSCMAAARNYANIPFITDLDDDIYNVPDYNPAFVYYHPAAQYRRITRMHLRVSDAVSASTAPLTELLVRDSVVVEQLPNCIVLEDWEEAVKSREAWKRPRVMFAGNHGRAGDLDSVREGLEAFMAANEEAILIFMGCTPPWAGQWMSSITDPFANRCFYVNPCGSIETYRHILNWLAPDVFINPIEENVFNKSKSHIKAFDAAMCGAALVCTDWETNGEVPSDCALKVSNTKTQWEEALTYAVQDKAAKKRLNERLVEWVKDTQTIDKHVHRWVELYERVIERGPISDLSQIVRPSVGGGDGMDKGEAGIVASGHEDEAASDVRG